MQITPAQADSLRLNIRALMTQSAGTNVGCWTLARRIYLSVLGIELAADYFAAVQQHFRALHPHEAPGALDIVVLRNHPIITNHCGVVLDTSGEFAHAFNDSPGVAVTSIHRAPWTHAGRIAGFLRLTGRQ